MYNSLFKYIVIHSYSYKITVLELEKSQKPGTSIFSEHFSSFCMKKLWEIDDSGDLGVDM